MGSIPTSPDTRNVPLLLCQELFNEASLSAAAISNLMKLACLQLEIRDVEAEWSRRRAGDRLIASLNPTLAR